MNYYDELHHTAEAVRSADRVLIGIGSGMSAAGGLSYSDPALAKKWYPEYYAQGKRSIVDIMGGFWPTTINEKNATAFWGFWAQHIHHIRYETKALQPYLDLLEIVKNKDYFICSTNVDGQLKKAGFDKSKIFAPQGDYALFQCEKPCSQDVYDNKAMINTMIENMVSPFEIRTEDIPHCPRCGELLIPNLRCDYTFVEKPHMKNITDYQQFLDTSIDKSLVMLELGVGFNTPGIIRYPFEQIALNYPIVNLIRVNNTAATVSSDLGDKAIGIEQDLGVFLHNLRLKSAE